VRARAHPGTPGEGRRRQDRPQAEPGHEQRVARRAHDGSEDRGHQAIGLVRERPEQPPPRRRVADAERLVERRVVEASRQDDAPPGRQGVRHRRRRLDPRQAVPRQVERAEER